MKMEDRAKKILYIIFIIDLKTRATGITSLQRMGEQRKAPT